VVADWTKLDVSVSYVGGVRGLGRHLGVFLLLAVYLPFWVDLGLPRTRQNFKFSFKVQVNQDS